MRCAVEVAIGSLKHPCVRVYSVKTIIVGASLAAGERIKGGQRAGWRKLENRPGALCAPCDNCASSEGCAIEVAVAGLNQPRVRPSAVCTSALAAKGVESGQRASRRDLENRPIKNVCAPSGSCPIEVAVAGLNQSRRVRVCAVSTFALAAKRVQGGQRAGRRELENRASSLARPRIVTGAPQGGCAIEVAVAALN